MQDTPAPPQKNRIIHHADALQWLGKQESFEGCSFVTSMPDFSEFPRLSLAQWKEWFIGAAAAILSRCPDDGVVIFYQRDAKKDGVWVDKGYLVQKAAEQVGSDLLWNKVVCRAPPGIITFGKPAYSHLLCFSKGVRVEFEKSTPDVLAVAGKVTWPRGMGVDACIFACKFILANTSSHTVVDPFCGHGSVLAIANEMGLSAIGVELSRKRAEKAQALVLPLK